METVLDILPFRQRRYEEVPIDKIKAINSRNWDQEQFEMNVESIDQVGLLKPIRVNDKFVERTGMYELICGEGRLLAHRKLGRDKIKAEVVTCTRKEAYLQSLIENIARTKPGSMDFARELKRLHDEGWDFKQIARIACKKEHYIRDYIRLVDQGEERLIHGVEQGVFPIKFATQVAAINAEKQFEKGKRQNHLKPEHIQKIIDTYQKRPKKIKRYARRVEMDEIGSNDFNLNISRYVSTAEPEPEIDLAGVHEDLVNVEKEIRAATRKHNKYLAELGLPLLPESDARK